MIVIVAIVRVHPGSAAEYEVACHEVMPKLRAADPEGIRFYHLIGSAEEPDTYRVIEAYRDEAAMQRHIGSALLQESFSRLQPYIADIAISRNTAIV